jgi:hypothetical protein
VKGNKLQGRVWSFEKVDMEFKDEEREREKKIWSPETCKNKL